MRCKLKIFFTFLLKDYKKFPYVNINPNNLGLLDRHDAIPFCVLTINHNCPTISVRNLLYLANLQNQLMSFIVER